MEFVRFLYKVKVSVNSRVLFCYVISCSVQGVIGKLLNPNIEIIGIEKIANDCVKAPIVEGMLRAPKKKKGKSDEILKLYKIQYEENTKRVEYVVAENIDGCVKEANINTAYAMDLQKVGDFAWKYWQYGMGDIGQVSW